MIPAPETPARSDRFYFSWYDGMFHPGEAEIECQRICIVVTRHSQWCAACNDFKGGYHPAGARMMRDSAKVDGQFGTAYTCLPCIEAWAKECDANA